MPTLSSPPTRLNRSDEREKMENIREEKELFHRDLTFERLKEMAARIDRPLRKTARADRICCPMEAFLPGEDKNGYELECSHFNVCLYTGFQIGMGYVTYGIEQASAEHRVWWNRKNYEDRLSVVRWIEKRLKAETNNDARTN